MKQKLVLDIDSHHIQIGDDIFIVYPPCLNMNDTRMHINLCNQKTRELLSFQYARFLMIKHLGHTIDDNSVVHHIDENPLNDELTNLQILTRSQHMSTHRKRTFVEWICHQCSYKFKLIAGDARVTGFKRRGYAFCSVSCALKYRHSLGNSKTK